MVTPAILVRRVSSVALLLATLATAWLLMPSMFGGRVSYVEVTGQSMNPTLSSGDLVIVRELSHYRVGEVIAYRIPNGEFGEGRTVIHRIVGGNDHTGFLTRGDNRKTDDMWHPTPADIKGARWFRIPRIGSAIDRIRSPLGIAAFAAFISIFAMLAFIPKTSNTTADDDVIRASPHSNFDGSPSLLPPNQSRQDTRTRDEPGLARDPIGVD